MSCTQVKCSWILPSYIKEVEYARVRDINFTSAKKMKTDLDATLDRVLDASFNFSFFAAISSASTRALSPCSFRFLHFSLALCPLCDACSMFPLSTLFLWPTFKVGTQSTLYLSQLFAALPETKWRLHTRSFARIFSVKSD